MKFLSEQSILRSAISALACAGLALGLAACDDSNGSSNNAGAEQGGAVFTMTNAVDDNSVVVYSRAADGSLTRLGTVDTGGSGEGRGGPSPFPFAVSGTSNPLVLDTERRLLYVVNPGSDDISAFSVDGDNEPTLIETQSSAGSLGSARPISLALRGDLLYVLNAGTQPDGTTPGSITGFSINTDGSLEPLAESTQPLTAGAADPSQISFNPAGDTLVVTDKTSQTIITYPVSDDGVAGQPVATTSEGSTPFGFDFTGDGALVVSDANVVPGSGPTPNGGTVSSYSLDDDGGVTPISSQVAADGTATCWVEITANNRYAYATNTFSGTVVGYRVADDGSLTRLDDGDQGLTTVTTGEGRPEVLDMAVVGNRYLYVANAPANAESGNIFVFSIEANGDLTPVTSADAALPITFVGLAAF